MMQKIFLILSMLFLSSQVAVSQTVSKQDIIAVAGGISTFNNVVLEWTLGESSVGTATATNRLYTIGFHQPLLICRSIKPTGETESLPVTLSPNPVANILKVQLGPGSTGNIKLRVTDMNGNAIFEKTVSGKTTVAEIPFYNTIPGFYLIHITDVNGNNINTYKIIKAN